MTFVTKWPKKPGRKKLWARLVKQSIKYLGNVSILSLYCHTSDLFWKLFVLWKTSYFRNGSSNSYTLVYASCSKVSLLNVFLFSGHSLSVYTLWHLGKPALSQDKAYRGNKGADKGVGGRQVPEGESTEFFVKPVCVCCDSVVSDYLQPLETVADQGPLSMGFASRYAGVSCHFLLQGIFPTQGSNPHLLCLLYCRQILYHWATREAHCQTR